MNTRLLVLFFAAFVIGLSSCKKYNDAPVATLVSGINVINASADTVNFYSNGTRLNNNSNLFPSVSSGYYTVAAGQQDYQVKKSFNPVTNSIQTLFSIPLKLDSGKYYSLFLTGETPAQTFVITDALQNVSNTVTTPSCYVRFVNASPDAGNLDLAIGSDVTFTTIPFKSASDFVLIAAGTSIPVNVYSSGSATSIFSVPVTLTAGYSYTFYSEGKLSGIGNSAFDLGSTVNVN
ncbi:MAG: DUF4397 domain-containing protein [Mucilaginibacter sp.]